MSYTNKIWIFWKFTRGSYVLHVWIAVNIRRLPQIFSFTLRSKATSVDYPSLLLLPGVGVKSTLFDEGSAFLSEWQQLSSDRRKRRSSRVTISDSVVCAGSQCCCFKQAANDLNEPNITTASPTTTSHLPLQFSYHTHHVQLYQMLMLKGFKAKEFTKNNRVLIWHTHEKER